MCRAQWSGWLPSGEGFTSEHFAPFNNADKESWQHAKAGIFSEACDVCKRPRKQKG